MAGKPLYRTAKESAVARGRKRVLGKSEWFGKRRRQAEPGDMVPGSGGRPGGKAGSYKPRAGELRMRSVLFVEHSPGGTLAVKLRDVLRNRSISSE